MADRAQLKAEKRTLLGKKVGRLRREGILPATVYGNKTEPTSIQFQAHDFRDVVHRSGTNQLIDLVIGTEKPRPVLIRQMAKDVRRNTVIHVEFFQPNLREKLHSHVPVHFSGESPAVREGGIFLPVLDHVDIESLPQDVPANGIQADISAITEINGMIHAGDLALPEGVTLLTPADEIIAKVNPPVAEEVVEEAVAATEPLPEELGGEEPQADAVPEAGGE